MAHIEADNIRAEVWPCMAVPLAAKQIDITSCAGCSLQLVDTWLLLLVSRNGWSSTLHVERPESPIVKASRLTLASIWPKEPVAATEDEQCSCQQSHSHSSQHSTCKLSKDNQPSATIIDPLSTQYRLRSVILCLLSKR